MPQIRLSRPGRKLLAGTTALAAAVIGASAVGGTAAAATTESTMYASTVVPATIATSDAKAVELGVKFQVKAAGTITGIRYYKSSQNTGTHVGSLWNSKGALLAQVTFSGETSQGWQMARLSKPVSVVAGTSYTASYHTNTGYYSSLNYAFASGKTIGSGDVYGTLGTYRYGTTSAYPTSTWQYSAYFVDVTFARTTTTTTTATSTTPVATSSAVTTTPTPTSSAPTSSAPTSSSPAPSPSPTGTAGTTGKLTAPPASGVPAGVTLTPYTGPTTISTDNTVIDGKDVPVSLTITAKNVTIKNSWVHGPAGNFWGVYVNGGSATITDTKVSNTLNAITGDNYTATRVEITATGQDGFKIGDNVHIDHSWCHDLTPVTGAHADCGQVEGGIVNVSITNSWLDGADNSALIIKPDFGPTTDGPLLIDNNVLGKGNFTLYVVPGPNGPYYIHNITVSNNQFLRDYRYGPTDITMPVTASGNTWFDTGAALSM